VHPNPAESRTLLEDENRAPVFETCTIAGCGDLGLAFVVSAGQTAVDPTDARKIMLQTSNRETARRNVVTVHGLLAGVMNFVAHSR
jgi:hypothetical protein